MESIEPSLEISRPCVPYHAIILCPSEPYLEAFWILSCRSIMGALGDAMGEWQWQPLETCDDGTAC
jgi:hypothetical protein